MLHIILLKKSTTSNEQVENVVIAGPESGCCNGMLQLLRH
jgi:hypothetical protein